MENPATALRPSQDDFNVFTQYLLDENKKGNRPLVELRNGTIYPIMWFVDPYDNEYQYFSFQKDGTYLIWHNDGTSKRGSDLDMMNTI